MNGPLAQYEAGCTSARIDVAQAVLLARLLRVCLEDKDDARIETEGLESDLVSVLHVAATRLAEVTGSAVQGRRG